jgi:hypothetical protein
MYLYLQLYLEFTPVVGGEREGGPAGEGRHAGPLAVAALAGQGAVAVVLPSINEQGLGSQIAPLHHSIVWEKTPYRRRGWYAGPLAVAALAGQGAVALVLPGRRGGRGDVRDRGEGDRASIRSDIAPLHHSMVLEKTPLRPGW